MEPMVQEVERIEGAAQQMYGRPYHMLDEDEKNALATAFGAKRERIDRAMDLGEAVLAEGLKPAPLLQAGNVAAANWGGALAGVAKTAAAAKMIRKSREEGKLLDEQEKAARRAAGDVGAYRYNMIADALRQPQQVNVNTTPPFVPPQQQRPTAMASNMVGGGPAPTPGANYVTPVGQPGGPAQPNVGGTPAVPTPGTPEEFTNYFQGMGAISPDANDPVYQSMMRRKREEIERRKRAAAGMFPGGY